MDLMAEPDENEVRQWLDQAAGGDTDSWRRLVERHHDRLRRMVAVRLDQRLRGRVDPSDVLQETYLEAATRLPDYLRRPDLPFRLWLRLLAGDRLAKLHRHHLGTQMRAAGREMSLDLLAPPDASSAVLAAALAGGADRPSEAAARAERQQRLQEILEGMEPLDREVLALRHFEQLSNADAAVVLGVGEEAAKKRHVRALARLRKALADEPGGLEGWLP
jgi:RNA polymerase sigma-70 factor (ECF subfamily)